jgi:transaldolase
MVAIYADCSDLDKIAEYAEDARIDGFTTNPSIMRKAGIKRYRDFAAQAIKLSRDKPISLEVLADDFSSMEKQARTIADWGENVYVKIPITNTKGESSRPLVRRLDKLKLNVTAVMTHDQIEHILPSMWPHHILSVFNGRITDTQRAPLHPWKPDDSPQWLWASARHVGNKADANRLGYDIITLTPDLIAKLDLTWKDLTAYSLDTVKQFFNDGKDIEF